MKLKNKLLFAQIVVFLIMFVILTSVLSEIVYRTVSENDCENAMILNEQIMTRMDQVFEELVRFSNVVASDDGLDERIENYIEDPGEANAAKVRLYLSQAGIKDKIQSYGVLGIYVEAEKGGETYEFYTVGLPDNIQNYVKGSLEYINLEEEKYSFLSPFSYKIESDTVFGNNFQKAYGYATKYKFNDIKGSVTVIAAFDKLKYIAENMKNYCEDYLLLDEENHPVEPSVLNSQIRVEETLKGLTYGKSYKEGSYKEKDAVVAARYSEYGGWKIICRLTREEILANNRYLILLAELLVGFFGLGVVLVMVPIVRHFTRPLMEVSGRMNEIAKGNLQVRIEIQSTDEIGEVGKSFNIMAEKLQENIEKMLEQEKREQRLKYGLMISQVDPHFIYNTMNTITYLAQKSRNEDVIAVNKAMIEILRDRLRIEIDNVYDTVWQEIKVVEQYLLIQKYRYSGIFKAKIEVEKETREFYIAKNILQPLVENALFHGIFCNKDEEGEIIGGCVTVTVRLMDQYLKIVVEDNGAGMSEEMAEQLEHQRAAKIRGEHIGIRNIKERLRYIYESDFSFTIQSKEGEGTKVILQVPIVK